MTSKVARGALYGSVQRETGKWHDELRHSSLTFIRGARPDASEAGRRRQRRKRDAAKLQLAAYGDEDNSAQRGTTAVPVAAQRHYKRGPTMDVIERERETMDRFKQWANTLTLEEARVALCSLADWLEGAEAFRVSEGGIAYFASSGEALVPSQQDRLNAEYE